MIEAQAAAPPARAGQPWPWSSRRGRTAAVAAALGLLLLSSWVAVRQAPPDPLRPGSGPASLAWWLQPLEPGAGRRLHRVDVDLHDVFALPGTGEVWAVGGGGLILHSGDAGRTWERQFTVYTGLDGRFTGGGEVPATEPL